MDNEYNEVFCPFMFTGVAGAITKALGVTPPQKSEKPLDIIEKLI